MHQVQEKREKRWPLIVFSLCVFAFLMVFFLGYHPLVVNNLDDWTYLSFSRPAVPQQDAWNPARILPEILMPACAQLAVWLILPVTGDYLLSMSLVFNTALCLMITLYAALFARLLMRLMKTGMPLAILLSVLFVVFHFRSWMSPWIPSQHLFFSEGLTTTYYYTMPALLNLVLVMLMESSQQGNALVSKERPIIGGVMILLIYLAVFSNLYSSVILAVYCGVCMALSFVHTLMKRTPLRAWLKENLLGGGVLAAWFASMVFEFFGGRAGSMGGDEPLLARIGETLSILLVEIERMEDTVFWLCVLMMAAGLAALLLSRMKGEADRAYACAMLRWLLCAGLTLAYLILLSAAAAPAYIARKDVLLGVMFFVFEAAFCSLAYAAEKWRQLVFALPLVTFIMAFDVLIGINSFAASNALALPQQTCLEIGRSFVDKVFEADRSGLTEVTLTVPEGYESLGNWPYTYNMGYRMLDALRNHGLVEHITDVYIVIDEHFFETFGVD